MRPALALLPLLATLAVPSQALVLDYPVAFDPATYGDVAGVLDVTHGVATAHWGTGYDDLSGVAWGGSQSGGETATVSLASVDGSALTLNGFDLGIWAGGRGVPESVAIYEIGNPVALDSFSISENNNQHWSFEIGRSSTSGFIIAWTSPWWVAIDNIDLSVSAVPEPATSALMLLGVLGIAAAARRR